MMNKNNSKMTKKQWFYILAAIVKGSNHPQKQGALTFINKEIQLLEKKSGGTKTKTEKTNNKIKYAILDVLADSKEPITITEMITDKRLATWKDGETTKNMSTQKLTPQVRQLEKEGLVIRIENKKKTLFALPPEEKEEIASIIELPSDYFEYNTPDVLPEASEDTFQSYVIITDEYIDYQVA